MLRNYLFVYNLLSLLLNSNIRLFPAKNTNTYIDIEPKKDMAVRVGESVQILCKADQPLRVCRVEIPGEGSIVFTGTDPAEDGIEYYGTGLNTGQCGVQIARVKDTHDGTFKCSLTTIKARQEATASLKIIVASKFSPFALIQRNKLDNRNGRENTFLYF